MNAEAGERWLPGDRLPNVRLWEADGVATTLHADFAGTPLWLATTANVVALPPPPAGVTALCLGVAPPDVPQGWNGFGVDPRWLARLGEEVLWEADANLRLRAAHALPMAQTPSAPLTEKALPAADTIALPPVLQVPGVFEPELCLALIHHLEVECAGGDPSAVMVMENGAHRMQGDPKIKLRRETTPRDPVLDARMHERLMRRALPEIARVFNFEVRRRDPFKLLAYPAGAGYFRPHRDNETPDVAHRRFALSINLNQGEYIGGEFRYPEFGPHRFSPPTGAALVFSCSMLHEVLPVERGTRYAMTTFLA